MVRLECCKMFGLNGGLVVCGAVLGDFREGGRY